MIYQYDRITTDIYPEHLASPTASKCTIPANSPTHFMNLPTEIRTRVFFYYLLSLNLPIQYFHHLTLLGYWTSKYAVETRYHEGSFNLGRRISGPLLSLFLTSRKFHEESEDMLYRSFIFFVPPRYFRPENLRDFYLGKGARLKANIRHIQVNFQVKPLRHGKIRLSLQCENWKAVLKLLAAELPKLRTVGLAIDYSPEYATTQENQEAISLISSFAMIFNSAEKVMLRFVDVNYEGYGCVKPISEPLCSQLIEEEKVLLRLRDKEGLKWYHVARYFNDPDTELYSVAGLQARYERLKIRKRQVEMEVECLRILKEENKRIFA